MIDIRELAAVARQSELHDLRVGLTPDEADSIADEIERLRAENAKLLADYQAHVAMVASNERPAYDEQQRRIRKLEDDNERLLAIIRELFRDWPEPAIENMDGGDVQDFGVAHRILIPVEVAAPCGDWCACAEYGDFPATCYRLAAEFRGSET